MRLTLYSTDNRLEHICRQALAQASAKHWRLSVCAPGAHPLEGDICVWDVDTHESFEKLGQWNAGCFHLVLVPDLDIADNGERTTIHGTAILKVLKASRLTEVLARAILDIENGKPPANTIAKTADSPAH